jgi:general secretion pathway protein I
MRFESTGSLEALKLCRSPSASASQAGFTLIEALVALSIVALALTSIGALMATSTRGSRALEERLLRLQEARALLTRLPDRDELLAAPISGRTARHGWRIEVSPLLGGNTAKPQVWQPLQVTLTMRSSTGAAMTVSTVRLQHRDVP